MPDVRELGQLVKRKYPGAYDNIDDAELGRRVKAKYPGAYDQFTDTQQPPLDESTYQWLRRNAALEGRKFMRNVADAATSGAEIVTSALSRDSRPARETVELALRNVGQMFMAGAPAVGLPTPVQSIVANQSAMERVNEQRAARREAGPDAAYWRRSREDLARYAAAEAADPALSSRALRLGLGALPYVGLGVATGGSVPLSAGLGAAMELNTPENIVTGAALGAIPGGGAGAVRRTLGRGAAEILEAEGAAAARGVQQVLPGMEGILEASIAKAAQRSPWQDTVLAYYRASLLTNPAGRAADLGQTVINQFADAAARPIAAAVDVVVSKLAGKRAITGPSLTGTGRALGSIRQGLRDTGEVLRTGRQTIENVAGDVLYGAEIRSGLGRVADAPINGVFRILGALDAPFRRFGFARNLYDRARVAAINEGKRGAELSARIRELLDDDGIIRAAVRDGERAVLSEPNRISSWLASQTHGSPNARLAIGLVQPFMRIPLNAVLKAADFSGLGGVKAFYKIARGVGRKARGQRFFSDLEDQRVFAQNVAAGSFGVAGFLLGMELEDRGKMEGYYYTSRRDFPNGKVPTSVNIGGENYDVNRLGGFIAAPLFIGATYSRLRKQDAGKVNAFLRSFSGLVQTAPSLGYYGVPAKAGRLMASDEPGNVLLEEAGSTASGFIPASGALGYAAKALDPAQRREAEGFLGPIMNRVPGLRQRLPVKETRQRQRRGRK